MYAASLKPYQRVKDGRGAHAAIIKQYAGVDKWDKELNHCDTLIKTQESISKSKESKLGGMLAGLGLGMFEGA